MKDTLYRITKTMHVQGDMYVMQGGTYLGRLVSVENEIPKVWVAAAEADRRQP